MRTFIVFIIPFLSLFAEKNEIVVIEKNQIITSDFYASGSVIEISGVCKKDVYVAAPQIIIDGVIEGDLIFTAGAIQITGDVKGSLRGLAGQALISGTIGKNTTLAAASFTSTPTANFLSNIFLASSNADISGTLYEDLFLGASHVRFSALSKNNAYVYAGNIRLGAKAEIEGFMEYSSPQAIDIQKGAVVKGGLLEKRGVAKIYSDSVVFNHVLVGSQVAAVLMNLFFTFITAICLFKILPNSFIRSVNNLKNHFIKSCVDGVLIILGTSIIGLLLLITILGIPIAVTLIAFSVLGLYTAKIYVLQYLAVRIKHLYLRGWGMISVFALLCMLYFALQLVPYIGPILSVIFTLAGLGASVVIPKLGKKV